uniref:Major facilitator superfamily (MFS) profile domain-containing protein n=1 Tax=Plectus sambesii TaxID=2011161 RepID=A0A914XLG5_9BILA
MRYHPYVVTFACAANFALAIGSSLSLGVFTEIFMESFGINNTQASLVISILVSLIFGMSPMVLPVIKKFGCRRTLILSGLLASGCHIAASFLKNYVAFLLIIGVFLGVVCSAINICSMLVVPQIFADQKSRQVAFSLANVGAGVGGVLFPFIFETLLQKYSWRQTIFITGAILLHLVPLAMVFPEHLNDHEDKDKIVEDEAGDSLRKTHRPLWKSATFLLLQPCFFVVQGLTSAFHAFVFPLLHEHGVSFAMAAVVMMIVQAVSIPGRLTPAFTRNLIKVHTFYQFCVYTAMFAASVLIMSVFGAVWLAAVASAVFVGFGMGGMFSIFPTALSDSFHDSQLHVALSVSSFTFGVGGFLTPIATGYLIDHTGTYVLPLAAISAVLVSFVLLLLLYRLFCQLCKVVVT